MLTLITWHANATDEMEIIWTDGNAMGDEAFDLCYKVTRVYWNYFCTSEKAWDATDAAEKIDLIVRTMAEYIDNDRDCIPDDPKLAETATKKGAIYNIFKDWPDREANEKNIND